MCTTTDGNGWYDKQRRKEPKSSVIDYFDRLIIQRQRGAVGKINTKNTLHCASACTKARSGGETTTSTVAEQNLSQRCGGDWGWQRGYCANVGSGSAQFCMCNHTIDSCLRESWLNCKKSSEHLWTFGKHSCGWYAGQAEAVGMLAGSWKLIQPTRPNEDGNSNAWTSYTVFRDVREVNFLLL